MKRIALFLLTNLLIVALVGTILTVFNVGSVVGRYGLNIPVLLIISVAFGMGGALISLAISRWVAKMACGLQVIDPNNPGSEQAKWVLETTHRLAQRAGLPVMPEVALWPTEEVNAFATGPSKRKSLVAVSQGLLNKMSPEEAEGVIGHEIAHIANGDMVTMALLQGVINTFVIFLSRVLAFVISRFVKEELAMLVYYIVSFVLNIVFSILGMMVVMAFSRYREFHADRGGAALAGKANMIQALQRLQATHDTVENAQPALAAMKISNSSGFLKLFSSHPPLEERIAKLQAS